MPIERVGQVAVIRSMGEEGTMGDVLPKSVTARQRYSAPASCCCEGRCTNSQVLCEIP